MSYHGITISLKNPYQGFLILFAQYIPKNSPIFKNQSDEKVLAALKTYCLYKNICYPSLRSLVKRTGLSKRTVMRASRRLEKEEIIRIKPRKSKKGDFTSNLYILNLKKILPYGFKVTYDILSDTEKVFAYRFIWLILRKLRYLVKYKIRLGGGIWPAPNLVRINKSIAKPHISPHFSSNLTIPLFKTDYTPIQQPSKISRCKKGTPPLPHPEQDLSLNYKNRNKEVLGPPREVSVSVSLGKLRQIGVKDVSKATIGRLTSQYGGDRIQKSIEMTEWWSKNQESNHLGGYFVQSVKNNYKTKEMQMYDIKEDREKKFNQGIEDRRKQRLEWEKEKISAANIKKVIDGMRPLERQQLEREAKTHFLQLKGLKPEDPIGSQLYEIDKRCFIQSFIVKKLKRRLVCRGLNGI